MEALTVQILGAAHPLAAEWLRWTAHHPRLSTVRLVAPEHAGDSAEDLHPALFGWRGLAVSAEVGAAEVTVVCPDWAGEVPTTGQCLDFRMNAAGVPALPELHVPAPAAALVTLSPAVLAAVLTLEPLLSGRVVSPRESIGLSLMETELTALRPLLTGHFKLHTMVAAEEAHVQAVVPLFEGYSEHDALAAYRAAYRSQPWVRLRREVEPALGVQGSPTCELHVRILEREDPDIPIPLLGVTARLDALPAQAARMIAALNLSRGWPALLGLVPA